MSSLCKLLIKNFLKNYTKNKIITLKIFLTHTDTSSILHSMSRLTSITFVSSYSWKTPTLALEVTGRRYRALRITITRQTMTTSLSWVPIVTISTSVVKYLRIYVPHKNKQCILRYRLTFLNWKTYEITFLFLVILG